MKNAPATNSSESAPNKRNYTPGTLPTRHNTVLAAVLARLLEAHRLTGMDSVFEQHTTRLSAVVYKLSNQYGWHIERHRIAVGTSDGRLVEVTAYWLPQQTIAQAFEIGARPWIEAVGTARAELRQQAGQRKAEAALKNSARNRSKGQDPRQTNLSGDDQ